MKRISIALPLIFCALSQAQNKKEEHWVATWATAQQAVRPAPPQAGRGAQPTPTPVGPVAPATPPPSPGANFNNQTVRMIAHASIAGKRVRIELSDAVGAPIVNVGAAHIAIRAKGSEIVAGSDRALTFGGKPTCTLRPGVSTVSDPVDLDIPALADLAVSLYFPGETGPPTSHPLGLHTTYISQAGDFTAQPAIANAATVASYYFLSSIDVLAPAKAGLIVALGDSITDGARSTADADRMWPALLAARLQANKATARFAIVNEGISGNQVLRDGAGTSALARFDRDVLNEPGVAWLMILESINDIGAIARGGGSLTAADLIGALGQLVERAHMHGIKVAGCTLTPYGGAGYYSDAGESIRSAVNDWIRTGGAFDAVVDFDAAVRDPNNPKEFRADMHAGDRLHPSDAGYAVMANSVDLSIFAGKPVKPKDKPKKMKNGKKA
jgi:lysophospholipase L1-like esterase